MNFRSLQYILAIAKHKSITKAANELFVSQPTLSKFLKKLEDTLGQPLFKKIGNKFLLTYAGEKYINKSRAILLLKKELDEELADIINNHIGELKIAFPIMRGTYMLPRTFPIFKKKFPNINISIHEAASNILEDMLLNGETDLAFFNLPMKSKDLDYQIISEEEVVLIMEPGHPLAKHAIKKDNCNYPWIDLNILSKEPFILQKVDQRTRQISDKLFTESRFTPKIVLIVRNIQASMELTCSGYGLSFVTETHLKHLKSDVKPLKFSIGKPNTTTSFAVAFRKDSYLPSYAYEYINIVKNFT